VDLQWYLLKAQRFREWKIHSNCSRIWKVWKLRTRINWKRNHRERERESNSSLRRVLGLKDFGSESMDDGWRRMNQRSNLSARMELIKDTDSSRMQSLVWFKYHCPTSFSIREKYSRELRDFLSNHFFTFKFLLIFFLQFYQMKEATKTPLSNYFFF